jgi:uncharacterized membrane protein YsdA (DUF1294 family)
LEALWNDALVSMVNGGMTLVLMFGAFGPLRGETARHRTRKHVFANGTLATQDVNDDTQR